MTIDWELNVEMTVNDESAQGTWPLNKCMYEPSALNRSLVVQPKIQFNQIT